MLEGVDGCWCPREKSYRKHAAIDKIESFTILKRSFDGPSNNQGAQPNSLPTHAHLCCSRRSNTDLHPSLGELATDVLVRSLSSANPYFRRKEKSQDSALGFPQRIKSPELHRVLVHPTDWKTKIHISLLPSQCSPVFMLELKILLI